MTTEDNTTLEKNPIPEKVDSEFASFVQGDMKIHRDRIHRVRDKYRELGIKTHPGMISRVAAGRRLTATQFYKLQSQLPAQIAYALQDAREKIEVQAAQASS
jgi:hypothetical protein